MKLKYVLCCLIPIIRSAHYIKCVEQKKFVLPRYVTKIDQLSDLENRYTQENIGKLNLADKNVIRALLFDLRNIEIAVVMLNPGGPSRDPLNEKPGLRDRINRYRTIRKRIQDSINIAQLKQQNPEIVKALPPIPKIARN
jgi:hypothetical protein